MFRYSSNGQDVFEHSRYFGDWVMHAQTWEQGVLMEYLRHGIIIKYVRCGKYENIKSNAKYKQNNNI